MLSSFQDAAAMNLTEFYNEVSRRVDTDKTQINVAECKRVLAEAFVVLSKMSAADATALVAKGIATGAKKAKK
ncbi:MAG: hypothetical protein AAGJ46_17250 [Planctomycetota bacterium]